MAFSSNGKTQSAMSDINITPLVDVVLVLLLIFMLTAPVLQSGIQVAVPHTRMVSQLTEVHLVVTIDKDQNVFLQDKPVNIHDLSVAPGRRTPPTRRKSSTSAPTNPYPSAPSPPSWTPSNKPASATSASSPNPCNASDHPTPSSCAKRRTPVVVVALAVAVAFAVAVALLPFFLSFPLGICFFRCLFSIAKPNPLRALSHEFMSTQAISRPYPDDQFRRGVIGAIALHLLIAAAFIAIGIYLNHNRSQFGESSASVGSIQASMVSAIPLPQKVKPVRPIRPRARRRQPRTAPSSQRSRRSPSPSHRHRDQSQDPAQEARAPSPPPRRPSIRSPRRPPPRRRPARAPPSSPRPPSRPSNGTATLTVQNRSLGERYAYYVGLISVKSQQSYSQQFPDPRSSMGRSVTITFYVDTSGVPTNVQIMTPSGSPTLDQAGKRAVQQIDTFGPNPANQQIPIEFTFNFGK